MPAHVICDRSINTSMILVYGALLADMRTGEWSFVDPDAYIVEEPGNDEEFAELLRTEHDPMIGVPDLLYTPEAFFKTMTDLAREPWFKQDKFLFLKRFWDKNAHYLKDL